MCKRENHYLVFKDRLQLPNDFIPVTYDLHITPDLKAFTFEGQVDIHCRVINSVKRVIIHSNDIEIRSAKINGQTAVKIDYYVPEEVAILDFENDIPVTENSSTTVLSLEYKGELNDKLIGFYRSKYIVNNEERYIGTTQFEPTDARRAFPCFDEPALKAVFNIKLTVPSNLTALSNMSEISVVNHPNNTKTVTFDKTPKMSTYLVAFVVGEFTYIERYTAQNVRVRVYKVFGQEESGEFGLDVAVRSLNFFCNYFEIPFPLTKCDQVAVPDFCLGAMENWGLVTYREDLILTSDATTLAAKKDIAEVIGHELAHQWFGNLVTMEWWDNLWLNEGFATFCGTMVTHHNFPEWNYWLTFANIYYNNALTLDALDNSHAIEVPVHYSSEINEIFDTISYDKGSAVIRMLENRFGENFRKGLVHYLKKHSYKNTKSEDLWESISTVSGVDVKSFIDNFTKKSGYPVISFKSTNSPGTFDICQKKFSFNPENQDPTLWNCFIKIQTDQSTHEVTLDKKSSLVKIPNFNAATPGSWIKPNYAQAGYYRIDYDPSIITALIPRIKSLELPSVDRLGLIGDVFNLVIANITPITTYMDLVSAFSNENESDIWQVIVRQLVLIKDLSIGEEYYERFREFMRKLLKPISSHLKFDVTPGEPVSTTLLREIINTELGNLADPDILAESKKRFPLFIENPSSLHSDIMLPVLKTIMRNGGEVEQNELISLYLTTSNTSLKNTLQYAISNTTDESLIKKALDFSLSANVRSQDTYLSFRTVPASKRAYIFKYLSGRFSEINKIFESSNLYHHMITSAIPIRMDSEQYDVVDKFFVENPVPIAERSIKQTLERTKINTNAVDHFKPLLSKWLENQK